MHDLVSRENLKPTCSEKVSLLKDLSTPPTLPTMCVEQSQLLRFTPTMSTVYGTTKIQRSGCLDVCVLVLRRGEGRGVAL